MNIDIGVDTRLGHGWPNRIRDLALVLIDFWWKMVAVLVSMGETDREGEGAQVRTVRNGRTTGDRVHLSPRESRRSSAAGLDPLQISPAD